MDDNAPATKKDLAEFETKIVDKLTGLVREVEATLLSTFHGYARGQAARIQVLEMTDSATALRLAALEERVLNLDTRRGPGTH